MSSSTVKPSGHSPPQYSARYQDASYFVTGALARSGSAGLAGGGASPQRPTHSAPGQHPHTDAARGMATSALLSIPPAPKKPSRTSLAPSYHPTSWAAVPATT